MPLTVPHTHLIFPVTMYDPAMPPMLPPIEVPMEVQGIVPIVAVELLNQLGMKASQSPVRIAGYNLVLMNNTMNEEFRELLQLTVCYVLLCYRKGYSRTVQEGIQERVTELISLWLSNLLVTTPELRSACSPQTVYAANQNVQTFASLKQEIQAMTNNTPMNYYGAPQGYPHHGMPQGYQQLPPPGATPPQAGYWAADAYGHQVFVPVDPRTQGQYSGGHPGMPGHHAFQYQTPVTGGNYPYGGPPNVVDSSVMAKNAAAQSRFMGQLNRHNYGEQPQAPAEQPRQANWRQVQHPGAPLAAVVQSAQEPIQTQAIEPETPETKELIIEGGSEMDRTAHAVAYFGEEFKETAIQRQKAFSESADLLANAPTQIVGLPDGVDGADTANHQLCTSICYDVTVENLELQAKFKYLENRDGDEPSPVYRVFGKAATPFAGRKVLKNVLNELLSSNSLGRLAAQMQRILKNATVSKGGLRSPDDRDTIAYLHFLDRVMTQKVNSILANNLRADIAIGSFMEDVESIHDFLVRKRGSKFGYGWDYCANSLLNVFIDAGDKVFDEVITDNYTFPEELCMVPTPAVCSFTFTELTMKELGFKFTDKLVMINKETAPGLYKIAASLSPHKKAMEVETCADYLVTVDGAKYLIYKNHIDSGNNFWIAKA